jgi:predicted nucleic-acid-binding protein
MKIIADTNLLVRMAVDDEPRQRRLAATAVAEAETVAISRHALCEMIWVLRQSYGLSKQEIADAVQRLCRIEKVMLDRAAVEAGLKAIESGADFADGVIDYEGRWLGGEVFVSFDKKAVSAIAKQGRQTRLLA